MHVKYTVLFDEHTGSLQTKLKKFNIKTLIGMFTSVINRILLQLIDIVYLTIP